MSMDAAREALLVLRDLPPFSGHGDLANAKSNL